jgi:hypothetical protein
MKCVVILALSGNHNKHTLAQFSLLCNDCICKIFSLTDKSHFV